jgi:RNA recognition motif-containing protein
VSNSVLRITAIPSTIAPSSVTIPTAGGGAIIQQNHSIVVNEQSSSEQVVAASSSSIVSTTNTTTATAPVTTAPTAAAVPTTTTVTATTSTSSVVVEEEVVAEEATVAEPETHHSSSNHTQSTEIAVSANTTVSAQQNKNNEDEAGIELPVIESSVDSSKSYSDIVKRLRAGGNAAAIKGKVVEPVSVSNNTVADSKNQQQQSNTAAEGKTRVKEEKTVFAVHISSLPEVLTEEEIVQAFTRFGSISKVDLKLSKGFGFVKFDTEDAKQACLTNAEPIEIGGKRIKIEDRTKPGSFFAGRSNSTNSNNNNGTGGGSKGNREFSKADDRDKRKPGMKDRKSISPKKDSEGYVGK